MSATQAPTRALMRTIDAVKTGEGTFDAEAWHVMNRRDDALIEQEILHGSGSSKFVYSFSLNGTSVAGISVIGARHLAAHYGGIRHALLGSIQKIGALFTFTSYPQPGIPMAVQCSVIPELEAEGDFYGAIVEIKDIKTGNSVQIERRENRYEKKRDGGVFERPHYATIAQSKAFRNGVLSLIPQDIQIAWKQEMLLLRKTDEITVSVVEEKRGGILKFAAAKAISVDRHVIETLTLDQIAGLSDAAREGKVDGFQRAAEALGVMRRGAAPEAAAPVRLAVAAPVEQQRQPAETAAKPVQQKPAAPAPAEQKAAPAPQPAAEAAGFEAYLIGADGEVVEDVFTDAVAFAEALVDHIEGNKLSDDERMAVMEHNADAIKAARAMPAAAAVLARLDGADHVAPEPIEVNLPFVRGQASWPDYLKAAKERLATVSAVTLGAFVQANAATIAQAPAAQRLLVVKAITERAQALGVAVPAGLADLAKSAPKPTAAHDEATPAAQQAAPVHDADEAWCGAIAEDVGKMATAGEIKAYATSGAIVTKMKRLKTERPELFRRLDDFIAQRLAFIADTSPAGK